MKRAWIGAAAALALGMSAASGANAATLLDFGGPTAALPSPDFVLFTFDAGAGEGLASFTIDGLGTLDGVVSNNLEDDFTLTVNGIEVLKGTWDLGGGGQNVVFFAPSGASIDAHANAFGHGGVLTIAAPIALEKGLNSIRFAFSSASPQGLGDEGWDLRGLTVTGAAGAPEPATWAMLLLGFFGLGEALRRSRPAAIRVRG
ncbi:MAG TPA: PEPxxWA-CTERM sorting domain-containing protein [Phenylobacterium sp.]|jgi:hypothetical protein